MRKAGLVLAAAIIAVPISSWAADLCVVNAGEEEMTAEEAKEIIINAGYPDIRKVEKEHGCLEGKGFTADQKMVEVYVHPVSGEIVQVKIKE